MFLIRLFRQSRYSSSLSFTRHIASAVVSTSDPTAGSSSSRLRDYYNFRPPPPLNSTSENPNPSHSSNQTKKQKQRYRPPSSLEGVKKLRSDLPFDFRYSYSESSPNVRPIGLREPKYSPFGPGRLDREWTGVCAPAVDPKVRSVDGAESPSKLEEKRRKMWERVQGTPLTEAERKFLVEQCQKNKTKRQINLGIRI